MPVEFKTHYLHSGRRLCNTDKGKSRCSSLVERVTCGKCLKGLKKINIKKFDSPAKVTAKVNRLELVR